MTLPFLSYYKVLCLTVEQLGVLGPQTAESWDLETILKKKEKYTVKVKGQDKLFSHT